MYRAFSGALVGCKNFEGKNRMPDSTFCMPQNDPFRLGPKGPNFIFGVCTFLALEGRLTT